MSKFEFSVKESLAKLSKKLEDLAPALENELNRAVSDIAHAAYAEITARAQAELHSTRQDYLKGLQMEKLDENSYLIYLDNNWSNMLEDGFGAYNLTERLLKSEKIVNVGRRSGLPWVQEAKEDKHKYAYVPFQRRPSSQDPKAANMAEAIQAMRATNAKGRRQKITQIFKDLEGRPLEGKVAIGRSTNPLVDNLVKYQKTYVNKETGKQTTQSIYINYRAVSEIADPWIHPGFGGLHAFDKAAKKVEEQLEQILRHFLG